MIIESNFVQAKSREPADVLYICVGFWLLALESRDLSQAETKISVATSLAN